jgi:pseudouridine synthase
MHILYNWAMKTDKTVRIDKFLASQGIASRRTIAEILQKHVVTINGKRVIEPGERFDEKKDKMLFDGEKLEQPPFVYIKLHKPKDVISTASDEFGRKTVVSLVAHTQRLYPVGRLDQDTTGLLLLTNDGELANRLTHPRYHIPKVYELTIAGRVSTEKLIRLQKGVKLEDGVTAPAQAKIIQELGNKTIVEVVLHQGKKRQIRRMCEALHLPLLALKRLAIGPIQLGDLSEGKYEALTGKEVDLLKNQAYKQ